jgi:hypothetical protein
VLQYVLRDSVHVQVGVLLDGDEQFSVEEDSSLRFTKVGNGLNIKLA